MCQSRSSRGSWARPIAETSWSLGAVNGWGEAIYPAQLDEGGRCTAIAAAMADNSESCPMAWVTAQWGVGEGYSTSRSAFWRVIRETVLGLGICTTEAQIAHWPSRVAWSNLYKAAPPNGGNPSGRMLTLQHASAVRLLRCEIDHLAPRRVLFLTGMDWAESFLRDGGFAEKAGVSQTLVEATGHLPLPKATAQVVVARHPQGKNEAVWVREALDAFGDLAQ